MNMKLEIDINEVAQKLMEAGVKPNQFDTNFLMDVLTELYDLEGKVYKQVCTLNALDNAKRGDK
jgi:hypothetical protein